MLLVALWLQSCAKTAAIPTFRFHSDASSSTNGYTWSTPVAIDNGSTDIVNDDEVSSSCRGAGTGILTGANGLGCMQSPPVAYLPASSTTGQWLTSFMQENSGTGFFSIYSALTSLLTTTFSFGTPTLVDDAANQSTRYVRYAKLSNGDVLAVFWVETVMGFREVYGNVFSTSSGTWGGASRLSTANTATDFSSDGLAAGLNTAALCRPTVAAAGDGSAMVTWCEGGAATGAVAYRIYSGGAWTPVIGAAPATLGGSANVSFPGFQALAVELANYDNDGSYDGSVDATTVPALPLGPGQVRIFETNTQEFSLDVVVSSAGCRDTFTARARPVSSGSFGMGTDTSPTPDTIHMNFPVVFDGSGAVVYKTTADNLITALLSATTTVTSTCATAATAVPLSSLGISMMLNPSCTTSSCSIADVGITIYYNRALAEKFRHSTINNVTNVILGVNASAGNKLLWDEDTTDANPRRDLDVDVTPLFDNTTTAAYDWRKSAMVSVAGDAYGNFAMVRSVVSPYFKNLDHTNTGVDFGRMLVGHEYVGSLGTWKQVSTTNTNMLTKKVSSVPACMGATDYQACSVRNPKIIMSESGKGLVFYYQNQPTPYSGSLVPNRLWFAQYSTSGGFQSQGAILDDNTYCSASSAQNDVPVCETGSYASACQALSETQTLAAGLQTVYPTSTGAALDHDVPPIATAMVRGGTNDGKAIVVYHKKYNSGTLAVPVCTYTATFARIYDPVSGFSQAYAVDSGIGNTMHAQVAMNASGNAIVVWEEVRSTTVYLNARFYTNGAWGAIKTILTSDTGSTSSLMPGVELNDNGEALISYSAGTYATERRQYVTRYARQ